MERMFKLFIQKLKNIYHIKELFAFKNTLKKFLANLLETF